ncbi:Gag protein [Phytophthora palmivora]|uniref:Gag protein n=1 Tax=Phytophthora palmivora TaxID=4796 RepID=A0A2P4YFL9_9STRA|nr:Gag protein [Phytophthora palmivora]
MVGIFGGDALRGLAVATPAEQVERIEAFDTYERGLITHVQGLQAPLRAAFLLSNYEYRQRSHVLACKQGKRELHEYIQEMRVRAAPLVGNPLPEHIKATVFMDGLKVGPSRTQLFRVHVNTMEVTIQIALQEEYSHLHPRTPTSVWQGHNASTGAVQGAPAAGASMVPVPMELGTAVQSSIRCYGCGKLGNMQRVCPAGGQRKFPSKLRGSRGQMQKPRPKSQGNWGHQLGRGALLGKI